MAKKQNKPTIADTTTSEKKTVSQTVINDTSINNTPVVDFFDTLGNKAWLVAGGLIALMGFIVFKDYLLFNKVYMFKDIGSDTMNGSYPYLYYTAAHLGTDGLPQWSNNWGMGQNIFSLLLRDPFDIFIFLSGKDHVMYGVVYKEFAKVLLGGLVFFFYLKKLKLSSFTSVVGALLFAFCGFMIVGGGWNYFSYEALSAAILLLSFELLFIDNKWWLFPIAIFLIVISNPVNLYTYGLFLATYALCRSFQAGRNSVKDIGVLFLKMAGFGLLGVIISAPVLIENIFTIIESPRGNGSSSYAHILAASPMFDFPDKTNLGTAVLRFFSSEILGSGNDFKGWQNILEAPMFYCGIPCLLLMPQVFPFLDKKARVAFIVFISIWVLPIIFPYFRYAFWLFAGDYYRAYSFLVSLVFMFFSVQALDMIIKSRKINLVILGVTVVVLFLLLNYPFFPAGEAVNSPVFTFVCLLLVVYGVLLFLMGRPGGAVYLRYIFLGVLVFELLYFSSLSANQRDAITTPELAQKVGYNDYTVEALKFVAARDKGFYRVDKSYASSPAMHYSLNDAMVQGYYGTSSYNSFNQGNYIAYLQLMGLVDKANEIQTRWATGLISRPILESENRVKYILAKTNTQPVWKFLFDSLGTFGDVKLYQNKYVLPLGYTYTRFIKESAFSNLSSTQKDFVSLRACVINDKDVSKVAGLAEFPLTDTIPLSGFNFDIYRQYVNELSRDTLTNTVYNNKEIKGAINANADEMLYLPIPVDGGWLLKVDNEPAEKVKLSSGITGVMLKKGNHAIEMVYHQRYLMAGVLIALAGVVFYILLWVFIKNKN